MKITYLFALPILLFLLVGCGGKVEQKAKYNYIDANATAKLIRENAKIVLIDIQEQKDFNEEHLKGAIATYAYPVKTDAEKASLATLIPTIGADDKVIIICPRGGGGADRAYDFYVEKGVKKSNIFTLIDGQYGWPRERIKDVLDK